MRSHRHVAFDGGAVRVVRVERLMVSAPEEIEPVMIEGEVLDDEPSAHALAKSTTGASEP
jgi:hypothetical protein